MAVCCIATNRFTPTGDHPSLLQQVTTHHHTRTVAALLAQDDQPRRDCSKTHKAGTKCSNQVALAICGVKGRALHIGLGLCGIEQSVGRVVRQHSPCITSYLNSKDVGLPCRVLFCVAAPLLG